MVEELSQQTKHANKILVSIFLTMNAMSLGTHCSWCWRLKKERERKREREREVER